MWQARVRFAWLWLSQVARVVADWCLRAYLVLELCRASTTGEAAGHLVTAILMLPAIVLAPVNGTLANSLPKQLVLLGSAGGCLAAVLALALGWLPWAPAWFLVAFGTAIYGPTRYALLPAAAHDARLPLTRLNGWIEMGVMGAVIGGLLLAGELADQTWHDWPLPLVLVVGLNALCFLTALPVRFASDVRRPESPLRALGGFFRDGRRIWREPEARGCLLGLGTLRGLLTTLTWTIVPGALDGNGGNGPSLAELLGVAGWVLGGVAAGSFLAGLQRHPRRVLGLVPLGATGLAVGLIVVAVAGLPGPWLCLLLGLFGGLVNVPLAATYQAALPADARGNGMALRNLVDYLCIAAVSLLLVGLLRGGVLHQAEVFWLLATLAVLGAGLSWWGWLREFLEQVLELLLWPGYRVHAVGPGLDDFPARGPALVVANHAAWVDPMFLAKVLPCRLIPMMSSVFLDLPVIRCLMIHVAQAIRVQAAQFRRQAPELEEAIAALDRGEMVIIFPEGSMRRSEEKPLRQFGQGVWHILKERPQTPVVVCWIDNSWGCFFSYKNGRPTRNKRLDCWRPIGIGIGPVQVLSPEVLAQHRSTRSYLMQACLDSRRYLGLEPLTGAEEVNEVSC